MRSINPFTFKAPSDVLIPFMQKVVNLETSKSQDASITSTAARTLVLSLPRPIQGVAPSRQILEAYRAISQVLIPKLLGQAAASKAGNVSNGFIDFDSEKGVSIEALDLTSEVIRCYGSAMVPSEHKSLEECLMRVLDDKNTGAIAKKRAIVSLAKLSTWLIDDDLSAFISKTVEDLRQSHITTQKRRLLIVVLGAISRSIPTRFGPYLHVIAPFVLGTLNQQEPSQMLEDLDEDNYNSDMNDLKEATLLAIEDFLICCSADMCQFTGEIIESALRYLSYNPLLVGESDDDDDHNMADSDEATFEEDDEFEQEDQLDDEDDASWKIRRCAGKLFYALIATRTDLLEGGQLYDNILPALIKAFQDKEESVQLEALSAATLIVKRTADTFPAHVPIADRITSNGEVGKQSRKRRRVDSTEGFSTVEQIPQGYASPEQSLSSPLSEPRTDLLAQSPSIVSSTITLLSQKSVPCRQAAISLLKAFVHLKHDSLVGQLDKVLKPVVEIILAFHCNSIPQFLVSSGSGGSAGGSTLRIEALQLLGTIFDTHSSKSTSPFVDDVIEAIQLSTDDKNFRIASQALISSESIIKALTPPRAFGYDKNARQYIEAMFDIVLRKADSNDADVEVRQKAIQALGVCVARTAQASQNLSASRRATALKFLRQRLSGEMTRVPATLAIDAILTANQCGEVDSQWVIGIASELGNHLRKADRLVRFVGLAAIKKLTGNPSTKNHLDHATLGMLTSLILQLYTAEGLNHIVLITEILTDLISISPEVVVNGAFNDSVCHMVVQNLGGHTLDSFLEMIAKIGSSGVGAPLMNDLLQKINVQGDPQVVGTTIGILLASGRMTIPVKVDSFISEIQSKSDDRRVALAFIVLGEVSSILGSDSRITPDIFVNGLWSKSELVQAAAATSLGRATANNTKLFMPVLFRTFQMDAISRTLCLFSVKELLQQVSKSDLNLADYSQQLWNILIDIASVDETRPLAAECIGRLVALEPANNFSYLQVCV